MPDLLGLFPQRNARKFFRRVNAIEQTQFDAGRVLGKNREIDAIAGPRRAERIWFSRPGFQCRHKGAKFLSITQSERAIDDSFANQPSLWRRKIASNPRLIAPIIISAPGKGSATVWRNVCIAKMTAVTVRIGLQHKSGRHLYIFPSKLRIG